MSTFVPQGKIELIKDVDIDVSYTHQYYFSNIDAQETFFAGKVFKTLNNGTYQRKNINTIQINYAMDEIAECKYLRWQNPQFSTKYYYAFVTSIDYVNPKVSTINYELDRYQTYLFDMEWKQSFIEREHCERWDSKGDPVINIEDEGLDYGDVYTLCSSERVKQYKDDDGNEYQVSFLVFGTTIMDSTGGYQETGIPANINYFIVPFSRTNVSTAFKFGTTSLSTARDVLNAFRNDTTLVNSLVSAYVTNYLPYGRTSISGDTTGATYTITDSSSVISYSNIVGNSYNLTILKVNRNPYITSISMGSKYDDFPDYTESKLLMYPYSFTEITTLRGDAINVKNEYISDDVLTLGLQNSPSKTNKLTTSIENYLIKNTGTIGSWDLENSLTDLSDSSVPIVDDYTASYLQSNSNANAVAVENARNTMATELQNANRSYNTSLTNAENTHVSALIGGSIEVASGIVQAVTSVGQSGISQLGSTASSLISAEATYQNAINSAYTSQQNTSASAQTDYQNTQATILAKVKDAQQVPATARALGGDYLFDFSNNAFGIYVRKKTIKQEYADKLTDYFKQYGYKVNRLETPDFYTRESWNYIKMAEPNIYGNIPMDDLLKLRDIFMKGITLWHGDYIGDYTRSNNEV